jgi:hypothetical protein
VKKEKKHQDDTDIELVSIEDLRTAMGGRVSAGPVGPGPVSAPSTVMCSGWSNHIPGPEIYF